MPISVAADHVRADALSQRFGISVIIIIPWALRVKISRVFRYGTMDGKPGQRTLYLPWQQAHNDNDVKGVPYMT